MRWSRLLGVGSNYVDYVLTSLFNVLFLIAFSWFYQRNICSEAVSKYLFSYMIHLKYMVMSNRLRACLLLDGKENLRRGLIRDCRESLIGNGSKALLWDHLRPWRGSKRRQKLKTRPRNQPRTFVSGDYYVDQSMVDSCFILFSNRIQDHFCVEYTALFLGTFVQLKSIVSDISSV